MKLIHILRTTLLFIIIILISSCTHRLTGTWTVQKYSNETPGQPGIVLSNIGTMTFENNGKGEKSLKYTVLGIERDDNQPFKWSASDDYVTIESRNSDFDKTWIILKSKGKYQLWKSTDGKNQVQVLELAK